VTVAARKKVLNKRVSSSGGGQAMSVVASL